MAAGWHAGLPRGRGRFLATRRQPGQSRHWHLGPRRCGVPSAERDFSATLLNNGQVLFSGGLNGTFPGKVHVTATATLFDPATGTAAATGSMSIPRAFHTFTVLPNGQVLAAGGET
jgi:hypothetical protein